MQKKDFFVDKDPSGSGRYRDSHRFFIDGILVDRTEFKKRRDRECGHRWNGDRCIDCHKSKAPAYKRVLVASLPDTKEPK